MGSVSRWLVMNNIACDRCREETKDFFTTWQQAEAEAKKAGWQIPTDKNKIRWYLCPHCKEKK
jgi:hypothetical protein